jgi:hypothetical protein
MSGLGEVLVVDEEPGLHTTRLAGCNWMAGRDDDDGTTRVLLMGSKAEHHFQSKMRQTKPPASD